MDFSSREIFQIKLTKSLIINLIEKCLRPYVFKNNNINPLISCSSNEQKFDLDNLRFEEFKNEVFNDTKIDRLEMVVSCKKDRSSYTVVLLKESAIKDEFEIALCSDKKAWIDDNLIVIKNFLNNYDDNTYTPPPLTNPNSINTNIENITPSSEKISMGNKENRWDRKEKIAVISIAITIVLAIIKLVIAKN